MDAYLKLSKNNILYNLIKLKQLINQLEFRCICKLNSPNLVNV